MGALLGLVVGLGLVLAASGLRSGKRFTPPWARSPRSGPGEARRTVRQVVRRTVPPFLVGAGLMLLLTRTPAAALAFGGLAVLAAQVRRGAGEANARRAVMESWPDAVDHLASAVRAGFALPEALIGLAEHGPEPLRVGWDQFARDYQAHGRLEPALDRVQQFFDDHAADRVIEAIRVAREVGGADLGRLLRDLSADLREDVHTRADLRARQAWTLNGARLAVAAPWLVLVALSFQPSVINQYATAAGAVVLCGGAVVSGAAYLAMVAIARLPEPPRVLR